jgi:hypothetical protein
MARQSFIVKFPSSAALDVFRQRIQAIPEYGDLRVRFFHDPPDAIISEVDSTQVPRLKEVAGKNVYFIADFVHDMF